MTEINQELKGAVEAIIFISEKPITINEIQNVLEGLDAATIREITAAIQHDYETHNSGIKLIEIAGGFQLTTAPNYANFVKKFYKIKHAEKLSMPALESLAIIAYKQPVTKMEIEAIRGVNVDGVIKKLQEKGLIRITGKKEVLGRPYVYGTTRGFLEYFGLNSLDELPAIEAFVERIREKEARQEAEITPIEEEELNNSAHQPSPDVSEDTVIVAAQETETGKNNQNQEETPLPEQQTEGSKNA